MPSRFSGVAVLATLVLWVGLFRLNSTLFSVIEVNSFVTWIFLPAALRMVSVLLVDWNASLGLLLGALITADIQSLERLVDMIPLALISGLGPLGAKHLGSRWMGVSSSLDELRARHLWGYAMIGAAVNSFLSQAYIQWLQPTPNPLSVLFTMFVGDVLGSVIMLLLVSWGLDRWRLLQTRSN